MRIINLSQTYWSDKEHSPMSLESSTLKMNQMACTESYQNKATTPSWIKSLKLDRMSDGKERSRMVKSAWVKSMATFGSLSGM